MLIESPIRSRHLALTLLVIVVWALSFAVLKVALHGTPPFLLAALRYLAAAIPAVFLFKPPRVPLRLYLIFGMTMCFGQFALLFLAIHAGMPSGLASLVMQSHAFFTLMLAAIFLKEKWQVNQLVGLLLAVAGLVVLGIASDAFMPLTGVLLSIGAALFWSFGNICSKYVARCGPINQLAFVVWSCLVPVAPFLVLSLIFEGVDAISVQLSTLDLKALGAVLYMAWASTLFGYAAWNFLLSKYPVNRIAPFTLLVPILALASGWWMFDEALQLIHFLGCALLLTGLSINVFGAPFIFRLRQILRL